MLPSRRPEQESSPALVVIPASTGMTLRQGLPFLLSPRRGENASQLDPRNLASKYPRRLFGNMDVMGEDYHLRDRAQFGQ